MPSVYERLQPHWWSSVDEEGLDIPLTAVDQENALGERPIHIAAWKGEPQDIAWLLDQGAQINQPGEFDMTPLHYAYMGRKPDNVAMLIERGADRFARCDRGLLAHEGRGHGAPPPGGAPEPQ